MDEFASILHVFTKPLAGRKFCITRSACYNLSRRDSERREGKDAAERACPLRQPGQIQAISSANSIR
jgi:hypothetical protein